MSAPTVHALAAQALSVQVRSVSVLGPGMPAWDQAASILRGEAPHALDPVQLPVPAMLPPAERRRVGVVLKLAFAVAADACARAQADPALLPTVFSSTGGDSENCHHLLSTLASGDRAVSPTRFHNSVHNMPAGYWSVATRCMQPSTSIAAFDGTFAAGLLEAATQVAATQAPCLLVAFDTAYPQPLYRLRPIPHLFGIGMVLSPAGDSNASAGDASSLARLNLHFSRGKPSTRMAQDTLEQLRSSVPAARSLPMLQALARREAADCIVDYLDDLQLAVNVRPA